MAASCSGEQFPEPRTAQSARRAHGNVPRAMAKLTGKDLRAPHGDRTAVRCPRQDAGVNVAEWTNKRTGWSRVAAGACGGGCRQDLGGSGEGEHRWKGSWAPLTEDWDPQPWRGRSGFVRYPDGGRGRGALLYSQGSADWEKSVAASRDDHGGENGARFARLVQRTSICW